MKSLNDDDSRPCGNEDDKLRVLVDRNFFTKDQDPLEVVGIWLLSRYFNVVTLFHNVHIGTLLSQF